MAKKSFQDYFILFFMVVALTFQITWLSILCTVNSERANVDSEYMLGDSVSKHRRAYLTVANDDDKKLLKYKNFIEDLKNIFHKYEIRILTYDGYYTDKPDNGKYNVLFTILGPILLLTITLLLVLNHFLIKKNIISIIISGFLLLVSICLLFNNYNKYIPINKILFKKNNGDINQDFRIFYSSFTERYEMVRLVNMLMTIVFSAFYFIYVLK